MNYKFLLYAVLTVVFSNVVLAQNSFSVKVSFDGKIKNKVLTSGRLYVFFAGSSRGEPYMQQFPNPGNKTHIFAKNYENVNPTKGIQIDDDFDSWIGTPAWGLENVEPGEYIFQVLWDQDISESRIEAPNNLYSIKKKITVNGDFEMDVLISEVINHRSVTEHALTRFVDMKSNVLSQWWGKDMYLKASVLLPHNYDSSKEYPIRYNVAGYGGRYTRINNILRRSDFMDWWDSKQAPQVITVYLDGEGPFGDSYQMDSENSGPYGKALIEEFIPYIEKQYRGTNSADGRFVDGCSTGGWVSLGLQIYYPDFFNGVFSYSPDAVEFENYQLINIYRDENAYVNEFGIPRMVMRNTDGEPMLTLRDFIQYENVLGSSNTYLNSGGQFSAHAALYSPKGDNGLPKPLFDPVTGDIDNSVASTWEKYDFRKHLDVNWETLGPKLQGKIYVWMGDMDHFYLNQATRQLHGFLKSTSNPKSDANIQFTATQGHCTMYSDKVVLEQIQDRILKLNGR